MRFDLSDDEWALLEPLMPRSRKSARTDDRKIMNAIFYVLRTGMPWRDLPERYGPYATAYNRFNRWSRRGIWKRIFDTLASKSRDSLYRIDSTIVKAHRAASGAKGGEQNQAIGISRGGRSTKIHAIIDSKGRPLNFAVTGGQVHDSEVVGEVLETPKPPLAITADTPLKITSAASRTGVASPPDMTNSPATSLPPPRPSSAHSTGSSCESRP